MMVTDSFNSGLMMTVTIHPPKAHKCTNHGDQCRAMIPALLVCELSVSGRGLASAQTIAAKPSHESKGLAARESQRVALEEWFGASYSYSKDIVPTYLK